MWLKLAIRKIFAQGLPWDEDAFRDFLKDDSSKRPSESSGDRSRSFEDPKTGEIYKPTAYSLDEYPDYIPQFGEEEIDKFINEKILQGRGIDPQNIDLKLLYELREETKSLLNISKEDLVIKIIENYDNLKLNWNSYLVFKNVFDSYPTEVYKYINGFEDIRIPKDLINQLDLHQLQMTTFEYSLYFFNIYINIYSIKYGLSNIIQDLRDIFNYSNESINEFFEKYLKIKDIDILGI